MRWPWQHVEEPEHPKSAEWDETERQQRDGMVRERRERRALEARMEAILREFEALADPRLLRRRNDR